MKTKMTAGEHVRKAEELLSAGQAGTINSMLGIGHALIANAIELSILVELARAEGNAPEQTKPQPE